MDLIKPSIKFMRKNVCKTGYYASIKCLSGVVISSRAIISLHLIYTLGESSLLTNNHKKLAFKWKKASYRSTYT